jgi:cellulose synthase/poly-beta-1,6-N-acetylglucosamine synthase-like glycosyltransferase
LFYVDINYLSFLLSSFFPIEHKTKKLKNYPKISVIIPTRNEAHVIEETLKKLKKSDYPKNKIEIIIVDANSTDGTIKIAKKYANRIIVEKHPKGKPHALNLAIKKAKGELIYFLDADTWVHKDTVRRLISSMDSDAATGFSVIRNRKKLIEKVSALENNLHNVMMLGLSRMFKTEIVSGYNFIIRKKTLKKVGYYKDALTEDINISLRLYKIGKRIDLVHAPCSILVPKNFKTYWKQQERWRKGGADEIRKSLKVITFSNFFIKMPFLSLSAITGTVSLIMLVVAIIFADFILLSGFISGFLLLLTATAKYGKKSELICLPLTYIYYTIIEIASITKVIFEEAENKKVGWKKTPK